MLVSFHLASNRPDNLVALLDNLEERAADPSNVEVIVKVDEEDVPTQEVVQREAQRRSLTLKVIVSPRGSGFADLWKAYVEIVRHIHPDVYFVCLLSDEVRINERNWDEKLARYIGLFPDHIFRLRTTRVKLRNYYDFWECGFAPDSYAFHTKRWIDTVGDWNPCNGPDSCQQFIAYYLGKASYPGFLQFNRDVPIFDISFWGEGASEGMTEEQRERRNTLHFRLWYRLVSHPMQEELHRRARLLQAAILQAQEPHRRHSVFIDSRRRCVAIVDGDNGRSLHILSFKVRRISLWLANAKRTLHYHYYGGGGLSAWNFWPFNLVDFLIVYYPGLRRVLEPVLRTESYWILKEMSGMLARALKERQAAILRLEYKSFSLRHQGWEKRHQFASRFMRLVIRVVKEQELNESATRHR